jgi:hypothetical protein
VSPPKADAKTKRGKRKGRVELHGVREALPGPVEQEAPVGGLSLEIGPESGKRGAGQSSQPVLGLARVHADQLSRQPVHQHHQAVCPASEAGAGAHRPFRHTE